MNLRPTFPSGGIDITDMISEFENEALVGFQEIFLRIFAEFSRKFARKVHAEPHRLGLRFFFYTIAKVFRRFQVARDSFSLLKPRKLRSRFSKFRIFALIVLLRLEANFEFQKCAVTSPTFLTYRV